MNKNNKLDIDKNSIQYLKYRDIAIEFIKQGYNNIRVIYKKYYPNQADDSIDGNAYRLIEDDRFKMAMEEAWQEIKIEDLDIARQAIKTLYNISLHGKKEADRINAAVWLGKTDALFIDKSVNQTELIVRPEEKDELTRLRGALLPISN